MTLPCCHQLTLIVREMPIRPINCPLVQPRMTVRVRVRQGRTNVQFIRIMGGRTNDVIPIVTSSWATVQFPFCGLQPVWPLTPDIFPPHNCRSLFGTDCYIVVKIPVDQQCDWPIKAIRANKWWNIAPNKVASQCILGEDAAWFQDNIRKAMHELNR